MSTWSLLAEELALWPESVPFWWRDDDAIADSAALQKMLAIAKQNSAPVHLAVIPANLQDSLAIIKAPEHLAHCFVLQHGFDHQSYALAGQRKIELGGSQAKEPQLTKLLANLAAGHRLLQTHFTSQYLPILVPPWNRVESPITEHLSHLGYQQLSVLASNKLKETRFHLNVHIDIIDWKQRQFAGEAQVLSKIISSLAALRIQAEQDGTQKGEPVKPCGLMTHHLDHDEECWAFLTRFFAFCQQQGKVVWLSGPALAQFT